MRLPTPVKHILLALCWKITTDATINFTYDANGNITQIAKSTGAYYPLVKYEYDVLNQLTKETHYDGSGTTSSHITATYEYAYDAAGNLLSEKKDGVTTKTYTYGDSGWKDLLTNFNGYTFTYDAAGNPINYHKGRYDYYMEWTNGRQLSYMSCEDNVAYERFRTAYSYDANGNRTKKFVETEEHDYVTQSGKVVRETIIGGSTTKVLDFLYDNQGRPFALNYSRDGGVSFLTYYYILNLQGDVVKLINASGTTVATYTYNAWGEILTSSGSMASINPLRYRGYYYDSETGFYYLQSRYYDPVTHRFINADSYESTGQGFIGTNMFAYCNNNPVVFSDETGNVMRHIYLASADSAKTPDLVHKKIDFLEYAQDNGISIYYSMDAAAEGWAKEYRQQSKEYEWVSFIYEYMGMYYYTPAKQGMKKILFISDNVIFPTISHEFSGYMIGGNYGQCVAQIHSHPNPPDRMHNDFPSAKSSIKGGDRIAFELFGYQEMYIVPYRRCAGTPSIIKYTDPST